MTRYYSSGFYYIDSRYASRLYAKCRDGNRKLSSRRRFYTRVFADESDCENSNVLTAERFCSPNRPFVGDRVRAFFRHPFYYAANLFLPFPGLIGELTFDLAVPENVDTIPVY